MMRRSAKSPDPFTHEIRATFSQKLKETGFRKHYLTWNKRSGSVTAVVNIERSRWNTSDRCKFRLNVAVGLTPEQGTFLREYQCPVWFRSQCIERFGSGLNRFWEAILTSPRNVKATVADCIEVLEQQGLPWLAERSTPSQLLKCLDDLQRSRKIPEVRELHHKLEALTEL